MPSFFFKKNNNIGRLDIINVRLTEISEGQYKNIILKVDERERPRNTVCTGINWNYQQKDIIEIAEVPSIFKREPYKIGVIILLFICSVLAHPL